MQSKYFITCLFVVCLHFQSSAQTFFPERGQSWPKADLSNNQGQSFAKAVDFALDHEYTGSRDLKQAILKGFEQEPYHDILGPTKERGGPAGMIIKDGELVASWGDTRRVDMTFSVTKSFLSTTAGLAVDVGLIADVNDKVYEYVWDEKFWGEHNRKITWAHLLTQSSDWTGQLWGGYDWADRPPREGDIDDWKMRELHEPGTVFEYNDVRVNLLAYSLLNVWRKPLPAVLKANIMDPIEASTTWRWYGYENSWVTIDGLHMQSVSGGGHSGGGIFISTEDLARFGYLFLNNGRWKDRQLISEEWIRMAIEPSEAFSAYGFMWWLKGDEESMRYEALPPNAYYAAGFGGNFIFVLPSENALIVTRWLNPADAGRFLELAVDAVR